MKRASSCCFGLAKTAPYVFVLYVLCWATASAGSAVRVSEEDIIIPTYLAGAPDPNPMFYLGGGSQGAQGRVYPYPLYDSLTNIKSNKTYRIIYLENEYVRIGILPEIGGRLFEAIDKSNGYNFIYRQHVIKPALIGLIGAWISGGVEWNIPHHHRATTFLPVQSRITENTDGSKTVWVGELELRHRMRWAVGYTLRPGKSYLECSVRIINRTPFVNSMLCFANVAVHVNPNYQVIYPPSTRFVTFHGKREFTTWPIATTRYAGADFTRGVDVSWYTNHQAANSMFAWNYEDDFFAGYDHGKEAGIMSFADHHLVPGKKFWTWGNGPRGRMWDKILTDTDGPYIELMVGACSDNQPDYSWLQPYETKSFDMYWYPFRDIGGVKKATLDAAVNLEISTNHIAKLGFCVTSAHPNAKVQLVAGERILLREDITITPAKPFIKQISLPQDVEETDLRAFLVSDGRELVAYKSMALSPAKMPEPVKGPPPAAEVKTLEELYLAGLRIEQFHSPGLSPETYWEEALRRDPGDSRVNTALGIRELKQARYRDAEKRLRTAIERLSTNYTSPKDGEAFYYLGLALQSRAWEQPELGSSSQSQNGNNTASGSALDRALLEEAGDAFYKATWSQAWRGPAYYALAQIASLRGDGARALDCVSRSLQANALNVPALGLQAALLRHQGRSKEAAAVIRGARRDTDPLDVHLMTEQWLAGDRKELKILGDALGDFPNTGLETAAEYLNAGLWSDGLELMKQMVHSSQDAARNSPLTYYYLGEFSERLGDVGQAAEYRKTAAKMAPDYVFPFQWELISVLRRAIRQNLSDPWAPYYLGNLYFDWRPDQAVELWQQAVALNPNFAIAHRNLAVAYWHNQPVEDKARAIEELQKAVSAPAKYAAHFAELDELYAATKVSPEKRLSVMEQSQEVVAKRDDALSREIGLKIFAGKYDEAIGLMTGRKFSVWEGGSLEVATHWVNAHLYRGRQRIQEQRFGDALADFRSAQSVPDNLPTEQELHREAELAFWSGEASERLGQKDQAQELWQKAKQLLQSEDQSPTGAKVNQETVEMYYAAMATRRLGLSIDADKVFQKILEAATRDVDGYDGKKAIPGGATRSRRSVSRSALAHHLAGLCRLGLDQKSDAKEDFKLALQATPDFLAAKEELSRCP